VAATVAALSSGAVAGWWLIGDQSASLRYHRDLDYAWRAPDVPGWVVDVFGPIALALVVAVFVVLIRAAARGRVDRRWLPVLGSAAFTGVLLAGIARFETAGTIGANIGGGLAIMFGGPMVIALIVWIVLEARHLLRSR